MKTETINFHQLRNEEHFQFHTEFEELVAVHDANNLGIASLVKLHKKRLLSEQDILRVVDKSYLSQELHEADLVRDKLFRGFVDGVKSCTNHYDLNIQDAANRVIIVLRSFGNIARKSYAEETAALNLMLGEFEKDYMKDIVTMKMEGWLPELTRVNNSFDAIMDLRYSEAAAKNKLHMKTIRNEMDDILRRICHKINALMLINGVGTYKVFVQEYNERVIYYKNTLLTRKGRTRKKDEDDEEADENND